MSSSSDKIKAKLGAKVEETREPTGAPAGAPTRPPTGTPTEAKMVVPKFGAPPVFGPDRKPYKSRLQHHPVCQCAVCMKTKISEGEVKENLGKLQATMVDRRDPDNPNKALMKAAEAHAILKSGDTINMLWATGIDPSNLPGGYNFSLTEPKELNISGAHWKEFGEKPGQEKGESGRGASVFGGLGVLAIPPDVNVVDIPKMNALAVPKEFLEKYGAELIPLNRSFVLDAISPEDLALAEAKSEEEGAKKEVLDTLYLVEYQWDKDYIEKYVMKKTGGGGLFVETHPFPHVFAPLSPDCSGALILGVKKPDGSFDFAAFEIPFGFTMKVAANVIHGDSYFVGPYAIALTETELADSVLLKQGPEGSRLPQLVEQVAVENSLPLLMEHELATKVNEEMMVAKIRHEGPVGKDLRFFQHLPVKVLEEVRDLSADSQKAYDQLLGVVPYTGPK